MDVTIIIPAYNEENSIKTSIEKVRNSNPNSEIVVIDDGSSDNTNKILKELGVKTIKHLTNKGYGAAIKTGFKEAGGDYVAFLDADLTYDPKYIPIFLEYAKKYGYDCVWGNRFSGNINKMPLIRKIGNKIIGVFFFMATFKKVGDCTCGERLFRRDILKRLDAETLPDDLDFITALTKRIVSRGLKYREIPIDYEEREGSSKLNIFKHGYKMIKNVIMEK